MEGNEEKNLETSVPQTPLYPIQMLRPAPPPGQTSAARVSADAATSQTLKPRGHSHRTTHTLKVGFHGYLQCVHVIYNNCGFIKYTAIQVDAYLHSFCGNPHVLLLNEKNK